MVSTDTRIGIIYLSCRVGRATWSTRRREPSSKPSAARSSQFTFTQSMSCCFWIIKDLRAVTIYVFLIWSSVALLWYFFYGRHHSALNRQEEELPDITA